MKKKILIGAIALASVTTLVLAHGRTNDGDRNQMMQNTNRQGTQNQGMTHYQKPMNIYLDFIQKTA